MIEATSSFHDQPRGLQAGGTILTAVWESESGVTPTDWKTEFAGAGESIFLGAAPTALQEEQCKVTSTDFAASETLTVRESDVGEISAGITAENSEDSWSASKSFISVRLDFSESISSLFSLMSTLQDITIESVSWLYNQ